MNIIFVIFIVLFFNCCIVLNINEIVFLKKKYDFIIVKNKIVKGWIIVFMLFINLVDII